MKNIKIALLCILASFALVGCDDDKSEIVKVEKLSWLTDSVCSLLPEGQIVNLKFQSPEAWEVVDADSLPAWCAVYPLSGDANSRKVISLNSPANYEAFEEYPQRSTTIMIKSGENVIKTKIVQEAATLLKIQDEIVPGGDWLGQRIGAGGESFGLQDDITCNGSWTIIDKDEWIIIRNEDSNDAPSINGGLKNQTLYIYAKPNTGAQRDGHFTIKSRNKTKTVAVLQEGI
ncbi:MAG: BACON domain-containing carbohydrate-binding protein [Odoribacter sp.]